METSNAEPAGGGNANDTVSQSEVESLLAQVAGGDSGAPGLDHTKEHRPVLPHKFREHAALSVAELRKLRLRHEAFVRSLVARLSIHLRLDISLQMSKLETMQFQKFIEGVSCPTFLAVFKLEPLQGACLLDIPPRLGLSFVNRELGGSGQCSEGARPLSEIETRLLLKIAEIIYSEWCSCWSDLLDLRPVLIGCENNGNFVATCLLDAMVLTLGIEVQIGELSEQIQFCFPCTALDSLLVKLKSDVKANASDTASSKGMPKWNPALNDIKIKVTAEMPELTITTKELAKLKPGQVLLLNQEAILQARVCLAKKPKFLASVGTCKGRWAAKIVESIPC